MHGELLARSASSGILFLCSDVFYCIFWGSPGIAFEFEMRMHGEFLATCARSVSSGILYFPLMMCCIVSFQVLAPALNDNLLFHAFFIYNIHDIEWAHNVIQKLESQRLGFKCCCPDRDFGTSLTQPQVSIFLGG